MLQRSHQVNTPNANYTSNAYQNRGRFLPLHYLLVWCESATPAANASRVVERCLPIGVGGSGRGEGGDAYAGHDVGVPSAPSLPGAGGGVASWHAGQ